jgi:hypothetical protein
MTDQQIARATWDAMNRQQYCGLGSPWDELHPFVQAECVRRIQWCRERGFYPAIIADQIEAASLASRM